MNDDEAYKKYYGHREWYNKLWLSRDVLGYNANIAGIAPAKAGKYITRPIYNLNGMGLGAKFQHVETGDEVPPGHFWSEIFTGVHRSIDFDNNKGRWVQTRCSIGIKSTENAFVFDKWVRDRSYQATVPDVLRPLISHDYDYVIQTINIEMIGDKIIEVHLRGSPDPDRDTVIPIFDLSEIYRWEQKGYRWIKSPEDGGGLLTSPRKGFMVTQQ